MKIMILLGMMLLMVSMVSATTTTMYTPDAYNIDVTNPTYNFPPYELRWHAQGTTLQRYSVLKFTSTIPTDQIIDSAVVTIHARYNRLNQCVDNCGWDLTAKSVDGIWDSTVTYNTRPAEGIISGNSVVPMNGTDPGAFTYFTLNITDIAIEDYDADLGFVDFYLIPENFYGSLTSSTMFNTDIQASGYVLTVESHDIPNTAPVINSLTPTDAVFNDLENQTFSLSVTDDGVYYTDWDVDGNMLGGSTNEITLNGADYSVGIHTLTALVSDGEFIDSESVDFEVTASCTPDWVQSIGSCVASAQLITYTDENACGTTDDLPVDNGTTQSCGTSSSSSGSSTSYLVDADGNVVGVVQNGQVVQQEVPKKQSPFLSVGGGSQFDLGAWLSDAWKTITGWFVR